MAGWYIKWSAIAVLGLCAVAISVVVAARSESAPGYAEISSQGKPVPVANVPGQMVNLLSARNGRAFYTEERDGSTCFGIGSLNLQGEVVPGIGACPSKGSFPSNARPVLAVTGVEMRKGDASGTITSVEGFASDGVATVEFVRPDGSVEAKDQVTSNTFWLDVKGMALDRSRVLIAKDEHGKVIYREVSGPRSAG
jgi:hypothetical protein